MNVINNLEELKFFVSSFLEEIKQKNNATTIALSGDLGAGKTAFVQCAAKYFDINETITSPTFVIQKEYKIENHNIFNNMIHIDAYRLESAAELEYLGWNEIISNPKNIIFIEWPEQVSGIEMLDATTIKITILDNDARKINYN